MSSNCCISERPGNSGLCPSNSPRIQPAAHISTLVVWVGACNKSSGALYHRVTTCGVIGRKGTPNHLARPKSAKITIINNYCSTEIELIHTNFYATFIRHQKI